MKHRFLTLTAVVLLGLSLVTGPALADHDEEDDDEDTIINIDMDAVTSAIGNLIDEVEKLAGNLGDIIVEAGLTLLVKPFQYLAQKLSDALIYIIAAYPSVKHQEVIEVHRLVFQLSLLLAVPVFIWIGFQHITGRKDGIRPTVTLLVVITAGGLAPWLLHYPVELSHLAAKALRPTQVSIIGTLSVGLTTAVVIWFKAIILLALVILYVVRSFYLMWYVAAAPVIFLLTYFQPTRRYMSSLTGLFIGFLLIGPMDLIAYQLVLALLDMQGANPVPQYIYGLGGYFVMLAIPYQILSSSTSLVLPAMIFARDAAEKTGNRVKPVVREQYSDWRENGRQRALHAKNRFLEKNSVKVELEERSKEEVELRETGSRVRRLGGQLKDRVRNDMPEVEENWHQDQNGDWQKEAELNQGDD